jgi:hypothetical protein
MRLDDTVFCCGGEVEAASCVLSPCAASATQIQKLRCTFVPAPVSVGTRLCRCGSFQLYRGIVSRVEIPTSWISVRRLLANILAWSEPCNELRCYKSNLYDEIADKNSKVRITRSRKRLILNWSHPPGSNRRPADYESAALPTELGWLALFTTTRRKSN